LRVFTSQKWVQLMKRLVLFLSLALLSSSLALAQDSLEGVWFGTLSVSEAMKLRVAFHISKTPTGFTATLDSLDQGAKGIPVSSVTREGDNVTISVQVIGGGFKGTLDNKAGTIVGTWSQGGSQLPLTLKRVEASALEAKRPQNPTKPYPYKEEEVTFENKSAGGIKLAGTLTEPEGKGPFTAVVLITGSGPQNRDEELFGHKPFLVLSDWLTRKGIAVLRVDDRGIGKSQGVFAAATTADFATDVEAAIAYLKTRPEVKRVGLVGHSEGGTIGSMVAARNADVAFLVMMAGSGVPGDAIIPAQAKAIALRSGMAPEKAEEVAKKESAVIALVETEKDTAVLQQKLHDRMAKSMPEPRIKAEIATLTSPWYRYFLTYDPATALRKVKCPVLALNGSLDVQILPSQNLPAIRQALQAAGNKHFEIVELPGLNHIFQNAKTGNVSEYGQIEETISPVALQKISDWILKS
jgi:pimeloyl-ACP methyl ester carboxylesterase